MRIGLGLGPVRVSGGFGVARVATAVVGGLVALLAWTVRMGRRLVVVTCGVFAVGMWSATVAVAGLLPQTRAWSARRQPGVAAGWRRARRHTRVRWR